MTYRNRRLILSSWRRLTRWEFWPPSAFYPPMVAYLAYLMAKHRSLTLFTAANPAIMGGGFIGESKKPPRSEEHTSELQSLRHLVCRLLLEKKKNKNTI